MDLSPTILKVKSPKVSKSKGKNEKMVGRCVSRWLSLMENKFPSYALERYNFNVAKTRRIPYSKLRMRM